MGKMCLLVRMRIFDTVMQLIYELGFIYFFIMTCNGIRMLSFFSSVPCALARLNIHSVNIPWDSQASSLF